MTNQPCMKVLFITTNNVNDINGGARASQRNLECMQDIYGKDKVEICYVPPVIDNGLWAHFKSIFAKFFIGSVYPPLESFGVQTDNYDLFFFDSSRFGRQIKVLKRQKKAKVVSFFHNCEADYIALFSKEKLSIGNRLYIHCIRKNEKLTLKYSDACVFINERDQRRTFEIYGVKPNKDEVISMTMKDTYKEIPVPEKKSEVPLYTILGSYFKPNVDGVKWFFENVFPHVNIRLRIVGKDMHLLRNDINCEGLEIISNAPDLTQYMAESDYMLYPIFEGSGMKIKTCEALMWGKNIVGTPEAFSGYGIEDYTKVGACCTTADEFIKAINTLNMPHFNQYNRELFLNGFSYEKSLSIYQQLLLNI